jgi:hypothetical protein
MEQDISDPGSFDKTLITVSASLSWHWIPADLDTPVSAYLKLGKDQPYSLLLESVEGGAILGRYSAIGLARIYSGAAMMAFLKPVQITRYGKAP